MYMEKPRIKGHYDGEGEIRNTLMCGEDEAYLWEMEKGGSFLGKMGMWEMKNKVSLVERGYGNG
jgi:hypothetical protein